MKHQQILQRAQNRRKSDAAVLTPKPQPTPRCGCGCGCGLRRVQRRVGNQGVQRVIQANLKIGELNDKQERDAIRIAKQVKCVSEPCVQRQAARYTPSHASVGGASLTFAPMSAYFSRYEGCGGFSRYIVWGLKQASSSTNGYVVQRFLETRRSGQSFEYWEAWKVAEGKVIGGGGGDLWGQAADPRKCQGKWKLRIEGWAKYMDGYTAPDRWGTQVPEAGSIPSTKTRPKSWTNYGAIHRWYDITQNGAKKTIRGWDGTTEDQLEPISKSPFSNAAIRDRIQGMSMSSISRLSREEKLRLIFDILAPLYNSYDVAKILHQHLLRKVQEGYERQH